MDIDNVFLLGSIVINYFFEFILLLTLPRNVRWLEWGELSRYHPDKKRGFLILMWLLLLVVIFAIAFFFARNEILLFILWFAVSITFGIFEKITATSFRMVEYRQQNPFNLRDRYFRFVYDESVKTVGVFRIYFIFLTVGIAFILNYFQQLALSPSPSTESISSNTWLNPLLEFTLLCLIVALISLIMRIIFSFENKISN